MPSRSATPGRNEENVGMIDQRQHCLGTARLREIDGDRALSPVEEVFGPRHQRDSATAGSVDADHVGAQIRKEYSAEGSRTDAGDLEHLHTRQRTGRHIELRLPSNGINSQ